MEYLGKKVEAMIFARDEQEKVSTQKTTIVGICEREPGEHKLLGKVYYTVIDRQPVFLESMDEIKIKE